MAKTVIHKNNIPFFGNKSLLEMSVTKSFSEIIFELLSGKTPTSSELKLFEVVLNLSIDHGPETPSAIETIKSAQGGKTISEAVAAGILQINDQHGGAIEPAMELFYKIKKSNLGIRKVIVDYLIKDLRMPGFGHRIYEIDPRSQLLFKLAEGKGISQEYIDLAQEIEKELGALKGKKIPVNIDGAIAAILCSFGWDSKLGKAVFIIARTPGLCGQFLNNSEKSSLDKSK